MPDCVEETRTISIVEKKQNIGVLGQKTYDFAVRTIKAYRFLQKHNIHIISKQFLRSGTAIGANCREAVYAQSKADFVNKLSIALKEANETAYWLELMHDTQIIEDNAFDSVFTDCSEIIKLLTSIILTTKHRYLSKAQSVEQNRP